VIPIKVSNSRINLFLRCPYAHYLKYYEHLERKTKAAALQRGTVVHEAIEAYNTGKSWKKVIKRFERDFMKNTMAEERVELGDIPKIAQTICENYFACYEQEDENLEYIQNELHFDLPLTKTITLEGYIDALTLDNKILWPMEHKTYARLPDRDFLMFNSQSGRYIWALWELGYNPAGFLWNILLVKEPAKPKMTEKTNKLSLAAINSTPFAVEKGIKELGLDPRKYKDYINKFSYDDFFFRHKVRLSKPVVNSIMEDTIQVAKMIESHGMTYKSKNLGKDCGWCSYKSICQGELCGLDVDFIKKTEYVIREGRDKKDGKEKGKSQSTKKVKHRR
jgi:ATP-dependent helicase/DNAse subunit B